MRFRHHIREIYHNKKNNLKKVNQNYSIIQSPDKISIKKEALHNNIRKVLRMKLLSMLMIHLTIKLKRKEKIIFLILQKIAKHKIQSNFNKKYLIISLKHPLTILHKVLRKLITTYLNNNQIDSILKMLQDLQEVTLRL